MNNALRSRQLNPCDHLFWKCRGYSERPQNWKDILTLWGYYGDVAKHRAEDYHNRKAAEHLKSLQNNPNNIEYWKSRGWQDRPEDWFERVYGYDPNEEDSEENDESEDYDEDSDDYSDYSSYEDDDQYSDEDDYCSSSDDDEYDEQQLRSLQNNPNNFEYWRLRGYSERPDNWRELAYGY